MYDRYTIKDAAADHPVLAAVLVGILFLATVLTLTVGVMQVGAHVDAQDRASELRCLERGGKITVYAGGFTRMACEGMTKP